MGVTDGLLRLSVGLEDVHDLWCDLSAARRVALPVLAACGALTEQPMRCPNGRHDVRSRSRTIACMAKVIVQHVCSECGTTTGRWLGKCPGCGAFGTLVEELSGARRRRSGRGGVRADPGPARRRPLGGGGQDRDRGAGARPRARRRARARLARARRGRAGRRQVDAPAGCARQRLARAGGGRCSSPVRSRSRR